MTTTGHRLESLDVFRGATIAAMILVNNPGDWSGVFPPLLHSGFIGWTFADLVFPWFIFIMGVALSLVLRRRQASGEPLSAFRRRVWRRTIALIALGLFLNAVAAWPEVSPLRVPGVLQRIALSYLIAATALAYLKETGLIALIVLLLIGHWAVLTQVAFNGYPAGTLTPDHNVARYLDTLLFGPHQIMPTDPEGLLGTFPSAATALLGALAGRWIDRTPGEQRRVRGLLVAGIGSVLAGLAWSIVLPISKPLWTGSFVLIVTGLGGLVFAAMYLVVDVWKWRGWARPLIWLGVNPLAIYVLSEVAGHLIADDWHVEGKNVAVKPWVFTHLLNSPFGAASIEWASALFGIAFVAIWIGAAGMLYRHRIRLLV
jgi:predicted acyltransferase